MQGREIVQRFDLGDHAIVKPHGVAVPIPALYDAQGHQVEVGRRPLHACENLGGRITVILYRDSLVAKDSSLAVVNPEPGLISDRLKYAGKEFLSSNLVSARRFRGDDGESQRCAAGIEDQYFHVAFRF
jgi:hypothetical protein